MAMQALVIAHAAFGHNHFFKNNYLFQQWTDAGGILDYLDFAKRYIAACEERHGLEAVEAMLDAAHALMEQGVFRYRRAAKLEARASTSGAGASGWNTKTRDYQRPLAHAARRGAERADARRRRTTRRASASAACSLPEENLLYFLEKNSPVAAATGSARSCASCAISRSISIRSARPR